MVCIPLDAASKPTDYGAYVGGGGGTNMNDRDIHFQVICAIDSTKTEFTSHANTQTYRSNGLSSVWYTIS